MRAPETGTVLAPGSGPRGRHKCGLRVTKNMFFRPGSAGLAGIPRWRWRHLEKLLQNVGVSVEIEAGGRHPSGDEAFGPERRRGCE